ncbi:MAG: hypothetical protein ACI32O_01780 [Enterococcus sp.]
MKMLQYSTARLFYYKKQTLLYCLFSGFSALLLLISFNLYHLQTTLYQQLNERIQLFDASEIKENLPSANVVQDFYVFMIVGLLGVFGLFYFIFFLHSLRKNRFELINWRLAGLTKTKIFLFLFWQQILPIVLSCATLFLVVFSFQTIYQELLQKINLMILELFELTNLSSALSSHSGFSIFVDQQTFFKIDFISDTFITDTVKSIGQTLMSLILISTVLSIGLFLIFNQISKRKKGLFDEPR